MRKRDIKNGNYYYCVDLYTIKKFKKTKFIYINKPRNIFNTLEEAYEFANISLNYFYHKQLLKLKVKK